MKQFIIYPIVKRLHKCNIPFRKMRVEFRNDLPKESKAWFAIFEADSWASKKAMHPFDGCNPSFTIWDSKIRGKAEIAFKIF